MEQAECQVRRHFADGDIRPVFSSIVNFPPFRLNATYPLRHRDLTGACTFFLRTNDPKLLSYFPLDDSPALIPYQIQTDESYRFYNEEMKVIGPMFPIRTPDAGNSLVNAASLGIWGVEDTDVSIQSPNDKSQVSRMKFLQRSGIAKFMVQSDNAKLLKLYLRAGERRFLASADVAQSSVAVTGGQRIVEIINSDASLDAAYDKLLSDAEANNIPLSAFHIYVLANALKRPIVVYGDPLSARNRMRGIYLPTMYVHTPVGFPTPLFLHACLQLLILFVDPNSGMPPRTPIHFHSLCCMCPLTISGTMTSSLHQGAPLLLRLVMVMVVAVAVVGLFASFPTQSQ